MLKKLLGLVFNRWLLLALLMAGLFALVWWFGPLVAVGEVRPLDRERARGFTIAGLTLGVALWLAGRAWRARRGNAQVVAQLMAAPTGPAAPAESADLAAVRGRFEQALQLLRKTRFAIAPAVAG